MGNLTLSKLQKKQYKEIVESFDNEDILILDDKNFIRLRETLQILELLGYIREIEVDNINMFEKVGNFCDFDEWHKDKEREERKLTTREWKIAFVSALLGYLIPYLFTTVFPMVF